MLCFLNDQLLQGPDLTNNLVGVLTRFQLETVAPMAYIESMLHIDTLPFLWWPENDLSKEPEEYQMMVHLFGATSSPSFTNFALRWTADDNQNYFSKQAVHSIKRNFYVDDCLKSVSTESRAMRLVGELRQLLSKGGFRIKKILVKDRPATRRGLLSIVSSVYDL